MLEVKRHNSRERSPDLTSALPEGLGYNGQRALAREMQRGYVYVMSIKRITSGVAARIKKAAGGAAVSAWVSGVIEEHLDDAELEREWERFCRDVAPSAQAERGADALFKRLTKPRRRTAA